MERVPWLFNLYKRNSFVFTALFSFVPYNFSGVLQINEKKQASNDNLLLPPTHDDNGG